MSSLLRRSSKSMKKSKITTTNEPPNPHEIIDYVTAYKLQGNSKNNRLFLVKKILYL